jgi:hypothetical protein
VVRGFSVFSVTSVATHSYENRCSDTPRRRDIIPLAASRAGFDLASVVYFGDAPWDARVSDILSVPMIGIGRRYEQLRELGVRHVFRDYSNADRIIEVIMALAAR